MLTESLNSLAHCCQILGRPYGVIRQAADKLGIAPAVAINGVAHYSDFQVETLRRHFATESNEVANG